MGPQKRYVYQTFANVKHIVTSNNSNEIKDI